MAASLLTLLIWLIVVGFVVWVVLLVLDRVPFDATFRQVAKGLVIVVALVVLLLKVLPFLTGLA